MTREACIILRMPRTAASLRSSFFHFILYPFALLLLSSCGPGTPRATATPAPPSASPTPAGPQTLNVCMGSEPASLYLYADNSVAARAVRQAIYDGPIDTQGYAPVPVILESLPSIDSGISIQSVTVHAGERMVVDGNIVFASGDTQVDQLVVTFKLKAGLLWSDGQPLTADDSVYSFELASSADTPGSHTLTDRTASYVASDSTTVVWSGLLGYMDPNAATHFWTPLPRHAWGSIAAADLLTNEASARKPLGWGPYVIEAWTPGQNISLSRNPNYFRASEGLPYFSTLNFIFVGEDAASNLSALQNNQCDVLLPSTLSIDQAAAVDAAAAAGQLQATYLPADSWLHLDLGIAPQSYDDGINYGDRADFFGDVRMRQAVAQCVDRGAMVAQLAAGKGFLPNSFVPAGDPLHDAGEANYAFDPAAANAQLDAVGWVAGADGVRANQYFQRLELTLVTSDSAENMAAATIVKNSLDDCGIAVIINSLPAEQAFATGPTSPIFGRNFDLALFAWPFDAAQPACYLYLSEAIPGGDLAAHKYGWGGWNVSGWQNADYDAACKQALNARPGDANYAGAVQRTEQIFAEQVPALPLYVPYEILAARADFCGLDPQAGSDPLQDLESFGYAEWCQ
jgi:peptide/nickel transport system substrate-binding protein